MQQGSGGNGVDQESVPIPASVRRWFTFWRILTGVV